MSRIEVRLAGFGGQGIILAGIILGRAIAVYGGKNATQVQSYGPEARGGTCRSEVVASDEQIDYPSVIEADALVAMSQEAADNFARNIKKGGLLIVDPTLVKLQELPNIRVYKIPATEIAMREFRRGVVANMIMLGALTALTNITTEDAVRRSLKESVPKGTEEINLKAFEIGLKSANEVIGQARAQL